MAQCEHVVRSEQTMEVSGDILIGGERVRGGERSFRALTGEERTEYGL